MALVNTGTKISIPSSKVPTGFTLPALTEFTDWEYERTIVLSVDKATVENATKATTLTNIIGDAVVGIEKQVDDIIAAEFIASNDVQYYSDFVFLDSNISPSTSSEFYSNVPVAYLCKVVVYIKSL